MVHLQRIKNELVGRHFDAVELYPSQERIVDEHNYYHLWATPGSIKIGWFTKHRTYTADGTLHTDTTYNAAV